MRATLRKYRKIRTESGHILWNNPVLTQGLALPFAIAATTSLKNGVVLSAAMLGALVCSALVYRRFGARFEVWMHPILYSSVNLLVLLGFMRIISGWPAVIDSLGIYLPMVASNTLIMHMASGGLKAEGSALVQSLRIWAGFSFAVCFLSALRELLGAGTLWGIPMGVGIPSLSPMLYPFGGFILVGFVAAGLKGLDRLTLRILSRRGTLKREGGVAGE
jgi:electron transport complex protein RnfE